ncbi:MAG: cupin domain-containing protein [Chloroflexota bacterium]|nr:cupin domain-containing protein [Chloroflexota bacterium]
MTSVVIIRAADVPSNELDGRRIQVLADAGSGATEIEILRGTFAQGRGNLPHRHDRQEVVVSLGGRAQYRVADELIDLAEGDVLLIPAGALHSFEALERFDGLAVYPSGVRSFDEDGVAVE